MTINEYAWFYPNSGGETHPVGEKNPNAWGLYDMHGNIWEWVQDKWHEDYNSTTSYCSPCEVENESDGIIKGGSW